MLLSRKLCYSYSRWMTLALESLTVTLFPSFIIVYVDSLFLGPAATNRKDHHGLREEIREMDRDGWATTCTLRLSALFRHYSQSCLRCRKWIPEAPGPREQHSNWGLLLVGSLVLCPRISHVEVHWKPKQEGEASLSRRVRGKQAQPSTSQQVQKKPSLNQQEEEPQEEEDIEQEEEPQEEEDIEQANSDSSVQSSSSSSSGSSHSTVNKKPASQPAQQAQIVEAVAENTQAEPAPTTANTPALTDTWM